MYSWARVTCRSLGDRRARELVGAVVVVEDQVAVQAPWDPARPARSGRGRAPRSRTGRRRSGRGRCRSCPCHRRAGRRSSARASRASRSRPRARVRRPRRTCSTKSGAPSASESAEVRRVDADSPPSGRRSSVSSGAISAPPARRRRCGSGPGRRWDGRGLRLAGAAAPGTASGSARRGWAPRPRGREKPRPPRAARGATAAPPSSNRPGGDDDPAPMGP